MLELDIRTVLHKEQRYNTIGDWFYNEKTRRMTLVVSDLGNVKYEALIAIHEFVELVLCRTSNVTIKDVDDWDMSHLDSDDPGSLPGCPYKFQHTIATVVERVVAGVMNVDWGHYEDEIERVSLTYPNKTNKKDEKKEGIESAT